MATDSLEDEAVPMKYALLCGAIVLSMDSALAFDSKKYAQVDPETREWFRGLRSPSGFPCCDTSDGTRVEDPDYMENPDGSYDVTVAGYKLHVDKDKVLTGTNRVGYAILWGRPNIGQVYCFLPGARG